MSFFHHCYFCLSCCRVQPQPCRSLPPRAHLSLLPSLQVPGAQAALRRAARSALCLQLSSHVPSGEGTRVQTPSTSLLFSFRTGGLTVLVNSDTLRPWKPVTCSGFIHGFKTWINMIEIFRTIHETPAGALTLLSRVPVVSVSHAWLSRGFSSQTC